MQARQRRRKETDNSVAALRFGVFDLWMVAGRTGAARRIWIVMLLVSISSGASPGTSSGWGGGGLAGPNVPGLRGVEFFRYAGPDSASLHAVGRCGPVCRSGDFQAAGVQKIWRNQLVFHGSARDQIKSHACLAPDGFDPTHAVKKPLHIVNGISYTAGLSNAGTRYRRIFHLQVVTAVVSALGTE